MVGTILERNSTSTADAKLDIYLKERKIIFTHILTTESQRIYTELLWFQNGFWRKANAYTYLCQLGYNGYLHITVITGI
jgi:hypothetical protein